MIKLKNGFEIKYDKDFDQFFRSLLESIIKESRRASESQAESRKSIESFNEIFLKELMDNCIFVTHQLFEIAKKSEDFSKFIVTGFLFNSIILNLPNLDSGFSLKNPESKSIIH